jgi:hypothetical protein
VTGGYCYWWEFDPIKQLVLSEKNFSWMDVWELKPEGLEQLWLKACAIYGD